jgi:hypothetical protein
MTQEPQPKADCHSSKEHSTKVDCRIELGKPKHAHFPGSWTEHELQNYHFVADRMRTRLKETALIVPMDLDVPGLSQP